MFRIIALAAAMLFGLSISDPAQAQMVRAQDTQTVVAALQAAGYRAELKKDNDGDPYIMSTSSGTDFAIFFFGCTKNVNCTTVQFFSGFDNPTNASLSAMNAWNSENRFGRAYIADSGSARLEMDLDLDDGGMSRALFTDNLEFWVLILARYQQYVSRTK
jgi:Putative bacterial sensory transduction regulator